MSIQQSLEPWTWIIGELELKVNQLRNLCELSNLGVTEHHLEDGDIGEHLWDGGEPHRARHPLGRAILRDVLIHGDVSDQSVLAAVEILDPFEGFHLYVF